MTPRRFLTVLVLASSLLRLIWAACLGPSHDEAYHALFVRHPDWSYYDHPPMLALIESAGLVFKPVLGELVALRIGFILLFAGSTVLMYRLGARAFGPTAGLFSALVLNLTAYYSAAASTFALPDGPLLFFWLLSLDRLRVALERPERAGAWALLGLAWGGALLSKYHAIFLPAGTLLYLLAFADGRALLRRPALYLASTVAALVFSPVVAWNAANDWASFAFQGGRAVGLTLRPELVLGFVAGQAAYLFPWMWCFLLAAVWRRRHLFRQSNETTRVERMLLCQTVFPVLAFLGVACVRPVLPHWSLIGFVAAMPLLGADWAAWHAAKPARVQRRIAVLASIVLGGAVLFASHARLGLLQSGASPIGLVPPEKDTSVDMMSWAPIAAEIRRRGLIDRPGTFVFASRWFDCGQLAFALGPEAAVHCYSARGAHNFAHWTRPEDAVGRDGLLVLAHDSSTEPQVYERWFERIEPAGRFEVRRAGQPVRTVRFYRCVRQTKPFPFDGRPANVASLEADSHRKS